MRHRDWRHTVGNILIAIGLLILLGIGGAWGWQQWQGKQLRDQLRAEPVVAMATVARAPTSLSPALNSPTGALSATRPAPASPTPPATATATATAGVTVAAPPAPAPAAPTALLAMAPATATAAPQPGTAPVRLQIPDLKIDVAVVDMAWTVVGTANGPRSEWEIPENAAGRAVNSALLGEPENMVISGHNNIFGRVFMPISLSWPESGFEKIDAYTDRSNILDGRRIQLLDAGGRQFNYVIRAFYRLKDSGVPLEQRLVNARYMDPTGTAQLTVTTCWPPWSNTHRLVVIAEPAG